MLSFHHRIKSVSRFTLTVLLQILAIGLLLDLLSLASC